MEVSLRAPHEDDIAAHAGFSVSPEIHKMYGGNGPPPAPSMERSKGWYARLIAQDHAWCIDVDGALAGVIFLHSVSNADRNARLAMGLFDERQLGQGIGRLALRQALTLAFFELGLHRVDLRVLAYNERALRCYEAVGFRHEGRLRDSAFVDGAWHDDLILAMLASEFQASK
ncbi:MAG: GNAT family N-acetyltransferase [Maritimibacter sp.]